MNKPKMFQKSRAFETGLSDSRKIALTVLNVSFKKQQEYIDWTGKL